MVQLGGTAEPSIISRLLSRTVEKVNSLRGVTPKITHRSSRHSESAPAPSAAVSSEPASPYGRPSTQCTGFSALDTNLELAGQLGRGTFASVYASEYNGMPVAVKRIKIDPNYVTREIPILEMLRDTPCASVVGYHGHYDTVEGEATIVHLIMEKLPMNLREYAGMPSNQGGRLRMDVAILCLREILVGLAHLHAMRVCHRDLKPDNILVDPATNAVKICDFGSAKILQGPVAGITYICSRTYRAPELILENSSYSFSVDVWSLGCILAELLSGAPPFASKNNAGQLALMIKVLGSPSPDELRSLNPEEPPSLDELPLADCSKAAWTDTLKRPMSAERWPASLGAHMWAMLDGLLAWSPEARLAAKDAIRSELFAVAGLDLKTSLSRSIRSLNFATRYGTGSTADYYQYAQ